MEGRLTADTDVIIDLFSDTILIEGFRPQRAPLGPRQGSFFKDFRPEVAKEGLMATRYGNQRGFLI
jgi:hypothetical protein